jgi:O-antigen/teichoic acid export membrane protein
MVMDDRADYFSRLKSKKNSLLSNSAIYLASNILNAIIPFALLPILTRYLSPAEYGEVAIFQTFLGALAAFIGLSAAGAAGRKYYDGNLGANELKHFIAACLQVLIVSSLIVFLVIYSFKGQLAEWLALKTQWILWAVFVSATSVVIQLRLSQWQVRKEARHYGALQIGQSIINISLSLLFVVIFVQGADGRIGAQVWTTGIFGTVALFLLWRSGLLSFLVWKPVHLKEVLQFGIPLIPHVGGIFLLTVVDRFVINAELGLTEVGIYMVAGQLTRVMSLVFDAINKAYVPWLFERLKRDRFDEKRQIVRYTYAWFVIVLLAAALMFVIGPWFVTLIAGPKYALAGEVIGWLALGQAFGGMYLMVTNFAFYSKRTGFLSLVTITSGLINVLLLLMLIKLLGLEGAAIAYSISMAIRFLLTWWVAQRCHPMPWFGAQRFN